MSESVFSLSTIKLIHTAIWALMAGAVFYVLYSGVSGNTTIWSWLGVVLICVEGDESILKYAI